MKFMDSEHQSFYISAVQRAGIENDSYRQALFYTLGLNADTREHMNDIYNFEDNHILITALNRP